MFTLYAPLCIFAAEEINDTTHIKIAENRTKYNKEQSAPAHYLYALSYHKLFLATSTEGLIKTDKINGESLHYSSLRQQRITILSITTDERYIFLRTDGVTGIMTKQEILSSPIPFTNIQITPQGIHYSDRLQATKRIALTSNIDTFQKVSKRLNLLTGNDGAKYFIQYDGTITCKEPGSNPIIPGTGKIVPGAATGLNPILPDSLTELAAMTFACHKLNSISIPKQITTIPESCFYGVVIRNNLEIPIGLEMIGANAFTSAKFLNPAFILKLGPNITHIDATAFTNTELETLDIRKCPYAQRHQTKFINSKIRNILD